MCGIAGLVGLARGEAEARVRMALERLRHRGPDGEGMHVSDDAVLGMRRLAIIDVEGGRQPIYDESGELAVVCNGEIYNYVELFRELKQRGHVLQSGSDVCVVRTCTRSAGGIASRRVAACLRLLSGTSAGRHSCWGGTGLERSRCSGRASGRDLRSRRSCRTSGTARPCPAA
jgi:asparagine synthetase B (glutamine-hydrolysing)